MCTLCDRSFPIKQYLMQHVRNVHTPARYKCLSCGADFIQSTDLRRHCNTPGRCKGPDTGRKPFGCMHCGKGFSLKSNLVKHLQQPGRCKGPKQMKSEVLVVVKHENQETDGTSLEAVNDGEVIAVPSSDANSTYILDINGEQHTVQFDPAGQQPEVMELALDSSASQEVCVEVLPGMTFMTSDGQRVHLTQEVSSLEPTSNMVHINELKDSHVSLETSDPLPHSIVTMDSVACSSSGVEENQVSVASSGLEVVGSQVSILTSDSVPHSNTEAEEIQVSILTTESVPQSHTEAEESQVSIVTTDSVPYSNIELTNSQLTTDSVPHLRAEIVDGHD